MHLLTDSMTRTWLLLACVGCRSNPATGPDAGGVDAPPDAGMIPQAATGTQIVNHGAFVGGITSDGYVAYYDFDADGHSVAKVVSAAGGPEVVIATSTGTGKQDVRFEIAGKLVFAWTDRGNRVADLTVWSLATGAVSIGGGIRPGRAAATPDGASIIYETNITTTTVDVAGGLIAGTKTTLVTANSQDNDCWRDTDLVAAGDRLLVRFCPAGATNWSLRSFAGDGTGAVELSTTANTATYDTRAVWLDGTGALRSALPDGTGAVDLATGIAEVKLAADHATLAARSATGAILVMPIDGSAQPTTYVASGAMMLGNVSPDASTVLYATVLDSRPGESPAPVQPYTDVRAATATGSTTLVTAATSCPACLASSFTPDGKDALVLDPIDNSPTAQGEGPMRVVSLATGQTDAMFGTVVYDAFPLAGSTRMVFLDAMPDSSLFTGWAYGLSTRDPIAGNVMQLSAGAENFAIDDAFTIEVTSFSTGDLAGLWVAPLQ